MSQSGRYLLGTGAAAIETITGNSGGAVGPDGAGNVNVIGSGQITVAGNPGAFTETISIVNGTNGQLLIGGGAAASWANIASSGATITITNGANSINLETGGAVAASFPTDAGTATPALGALTVAGGTNVNTSGAGSTVTINLDTAISGIASLDMAAAGRIGTATSAGNTLLIQAYDVDGTSYTTFATLTANNTPTMDLDEAVTKSGGYIYRGGGTDVLVTDGGTGTSTLANNAVLVGSGTSPITALAVAADGQLVIGRTGADPLVALPISTDTTISLTGGAGTLDIELDDDVKVTAMDSWNGATLETPAVTVASDGATITLSIQKAGGGNLTVRFSDGYYTWVTAPDTVALTAGADTAPQINYIYFLKSTKTLTNSTTSFPATEHVPVATVLCQTAASVAADGAYKVHVWTDHVIDITNQGHIYDLNRWIRHQNATWMSGVTQTLTITPQGAAPDNVIFTTVAGVTMQLHHHVFPAFAGTPDVYTVNDFTTPYNIVTDLNALLTDSANVSMSGKYFTLVIWGVQSEATGDCHLMVNLPGGSYNTQAAQSDDAQRYTNYTIPTNFIGTGFLISELQLRHQVAAGGTWTSIQEIDLRGLFPGTAAGGSTSFATTFPDNVFRIYDDGDNTKNLAFQVSGVTTATTRTITMDDRNIDLDAVPDTFATDAGNATPAAGSATVAGGTNINTAGAGSTVTVNLDAAVAGLTSLDLAAGGRFGTAMSAGNTALIQAYDVDGTSYVTFATLTANNTPTMDLEDTVTKAGQYIYRAAGTDVPVTDGGTGVSSLTDHGVLVGSGTGTVTALTVGTDGQVLLGDSADDPVFATLTSTGGTVVFTAGAGTLNLETSGGTANSFPTDVGTATPALGVLTVTGGTNINTAGAGSTVTVNLDNSPSISGTFSLPSTNGAGTAGIINFNSIRFIHEYGTDCVFVGAAAGNLTHTGIENIGVGSNTLDALTDGTNNIGVGHDALSAVTGGDFNIGIGTDAGVAIVGGSYNTIMGHAAAPLVDSGQFNVLLGYSAAPNLTTGQANVAVGHVALASGTSSSQNTAIGAGAMSGTTDIATDNVAVGYNAMTECSTAIQNAIVGSDAASALTTGDNNTAIGFGAIDDITTGSDNIAVGLSAGGSLATSDSDNILIGNVGSGGLNNEIIIGTQGTGSGQQDTCTIAGIYNVTPAGGTTETVIIDSNGQLGTTNAIAMTWSEVTGASQGMAVHNGYILNNAGLVTATLPAAAAVGDIVSVVGKGAGGWLIAQNAGQTIHFIGTDTTTGAGGSLASTVRYDCVELICITANTDWVARSSMGNITIV